MNAPQITEAAREAARALRFLADAIESNPVQAIAPAPAAPPPYHAPAPGPTPARPPPRGEEVLAPFGRAKGTPLSAMDDKDLQWLAAALEKSIGDASKGMYRRKNEADLAAVKAELRARFL